MKDGGAEHQSLVSLQNVPGMNPKSLHSTFVVKANVLLTVFRPSDGNAILCILPLSFDAF